MNLAKIRGWAFRLLLDDSCCCSLNSNPGDRGFSLDFIPSFTQLFVALAMLHLGKRSPQTSILAKEKSAYGGDLLKTRAGRRGARPLSTRETMHLVLRSTKAKGDWSFRKPRNQTHVNRIIDKFSVIYSVRVISMANVGNHLHLQIKLSNRFTYNPFIRAVTAAIAMAVTGRSRWTRANETKHLVKSTSGDPSEHPPEAARDNLKNTRKTGSLEKPEKVKFWDYRPFTRVVESFKAWLNLKDYVRINELEGEAYERGDARFMLKVEKRYGLERDTSIP